MAGAYYPQAAYPPVPPPPQDDFADYMWMENEEEFDKQVMQQLEEEALMEQCIEAMLEDEQRERHRPVSNGHNHHYPTTSNGQSSVSLEEAVSRSTLNPLAAEFVPTRARPPATEEEKQSTGEKVTEEAQSTATQVEIAPKTETEESKEATEKSKTEEPASVPSETPEVSAADIKPINERKPREPKRDAKKPTKQEDPKPKAKARPQPARPEPKINPKKKEQKPPTKQPEIRVEEKTEETPTAEVAKQTTPPVSEDVKEGPKPVNYAAAARAMKPRKSGSPTSGSSPSGGGFAPGTERVKPPTADKRAPRSDKPTSMQRKNSAK